MNIDNDNSVFKRKFRWIATLYENDKEVFEPHFVWVNHRPNWIEETEINFLDGYKLDPVVEEIKISLCDEYSYEYEKHLSYFNRVMLGLYDGCGNQIEEWELLNCKLKELTTTLDDDNTVWAELCFTYKGCNYNIKWGKLDSITSPPKNQVTIE